MEKGVEIIGEFGSKFLLSLAKDNWHWVLSGDLVYDTLPLKLSYIESLRPVLCLDDKGNIDFKKSGYNQGSFKKVDSNKLENGIKKRNICWELNGSKIKHFDSCGASFLLSCVRYAKEIGIKLQFIDLPESIYPLLQVQGVSGLLLPFVKDLIH